MEIVMKGQVELPMPPQWIVLPEVTYATGHRLQQGGIRLNPEHIVSVHPFKIIDGVLIRATSGEEFFINDTTVQKVVQMIRSRYAFEFGRDYGPNEV